MLLKPSDSHYQLFVKALALCHNVTPVFEEEDDDASAAEAEQQSAAAATRTVSYQGREFVLS